MRRKMAIEMTPKEYQTFQKVAKKRKLKQDAEEVGIPSLAGTVFALEKRIEKLDKLVNGQQVVIQKLWAWKITREYTEKGE
jgi:hypothetical protein